MSDHGPGRACQACHAAYLIADALETLSPDDSTIFAPIVTDCGTVRVRVDSDDSGLYDAVIRVEVR